MRANDTTAWRDVFEFDNKQSKRMADNCRKLKFVENVMCLVADWCEDLIVGGYEEGYVKVWDARCGDSSAVINGRCFQGSNQQHEDVSSLSFSHKQTKEVHIAAGRCIYRLDLRKVEDTSWTKPFLTMNDDDINQISLSDDDQTLATADDSHAVTILDLKHLQVLYRLKKHKSVVYSVEFRPGKPRELISGGYDCSLIHWDVFKCRSLGMFDLGDFVDPDWDLPKSFNPSYVLCCRFATIKDDPSSKADAVLAGTENGNLHCFFCNKGLKHLRTFRAHDLGVTQVAFSPESNGSKGVIYTGSNDGRIKLWKSDILFSEDESPLCKPEATQVIDHGQKINYLGLFQGKELLVCDTTSNISLLPLIT